MSAEASMMIEPTDTNGHKPFALSALTNSNDGRVVFYRGELYLSDVELQEVNQILSCSGNPQGKVSMVEVKTPPLIPSLYTPAVPSLSIFTPLPPRSTRGSVVGTSGPVTGPSAGSDKSKEKLAISEPKRSSGVVSTSSSPHAPGAGGKFSGGKSSMTTMDPLPTISSNKQKIQAVLREAFITLSADPDYTCLEAQYTPPTLSPPVTMSSIRERIEAESYEDHFQFMNDLVSVTRYWLQGPPVPNPLLPQYMASLKLARNGTDVMMNMVGEIDNEDYYQGPDVDAVIKLETKRDQIEALKHNRSSSSVGSPSYARKIRRTESNGGSGSSSSKTKDLKQIQEQVSMLTEHVLGMQKSAASTSKPVRSSEGGEANFAHRPLNAEEIRKLETDLMKLSSEDIDHIIGHILKDEPSVRVDDESYELDVAALPPAKQRNLRRFVSRRLNIRDPSFGAQKLKQLLRDDERAKASEEFAERLLAAGPMVAASAPISAPVSRQSPEEEEVDRQRVLREKQREEEAKRLWQLAHGDDDDDDDDGQNNEEAMNDD